MTCMDSRLDVFAALGPRRRRGAHPAQRRRRDHRRRDPLAGRLPAAARDARGDADPPHRLRDACAQRRRLSRGAAAGDRRRAGVRDRVVHATSTPTCASRSCASAARRSCRTARSCAASSTTSTRIACARSRSTLERSRTIGRLAAHDRRRPIGRASRLRELPVRDLRRRAGRADARSCRSRPPSCRSAPREKLGAEAYGYVAGGAGSERTMRPTSTRSSAGGSCRACCATSPSATSPRRCSATPMPAPLHARARGRSVDRAPRGRARGARAAAALGAVHPQHRRLALDRAGRRGDGRGAALVSALLAARARAGRELRRSAPSGPATRRSC